MWRCKTWKMVSWKSTRKICACGNLSQRCHKLELCGPTLSSFSTSSYQASARWLALALVILTSTRPNWESVSSSFWPPSTLLGGLFRFTGATSSSKSLRVTTTRLRIWSTPHQEIQDSPQRQVASLSNLRSAGRTTPTKMHENSNTYIHSS